MPSHTGDLFASQPPPARVNGPRSSDQREPNRGAQASASSVRSSAEGSAWELTAHCDGGARGNPGPAGFGAEIRDRNGMVVAELSEFLGICSNNVAEYSGLLACLQYALDHGASSLSVVSDSELMVKQIQGRYKVNSPDLKPLWTEAKRRIAKLARFEIAHALRHKNKAADRLANEAMDRGTRRGRPPGEPAPPPLRATPYPNANAAKRNANTAKPLAPASPETPVPIVRGGGDPSRTPSQPLDSGEPRADDVPKPQMLRGFTRDGVIHILGSHTLADGRFVKIIPE